MPRSDPVLRELAEQRAAQAAVAREKHQATLNVGLMIYIDAMQSVAKEDHTQFKDAVHLDVLQAMIKPGHESSPKVTALIADIAKDEDVSEAICSSGGITSLVRILEGFEEDVESAANAAQCLSNMYRNCKDQAVICRRIIDAQVAPPVVAMLASADSLRARKLAAGLLLNFTFHAGSSDDYRRLSDAGAVATLLGALTSESNDQLVKSRAVISLSNFACSPSYRAPIFEAMSMSMLEQLIGPLKEVPCQGCQDKLLARLVKSAEKELADGDGNLLKAATLLTNLEGNTHAKPSEGVVDRARTRLALLTKRASLGLSDLAMPAEFKCPISMCVMKDPVVASDGMSYERTEIQRVLQKQPAQRLSPLTRERLDTKVFPNVNLRKRIADYEADVLRAAETSRAALGSDAVEQPVQKSARRA